MMRNSAVAGTSRGRVAELTALGNTPAEPNRPIPRESGEKAANPTQRLVDASVLADFLGVSRAYVYEHGEQLGAIRLGAGPRARLRFDPDLALERLTACTTGRESEVAASSMVEPTAPRRRRQRLGSGVELLPVRGPRVPRS
jgi:hypothetical protein